VFLLTIDLLHAMSDKKEELQKGEWEEPWKNSDAVLSAEEKEIHVHSLVLSMASPVFERMLEGDFKESKTKRVEMEGKKHKHVLILVKMLYSVYHVDLGN